MENGIGLLLLVLFGGAGLISTFTIINLLLPMPVARTRAELEASLVRSFLLGLVNFIFVAAVDALMVWLAQQVGGGVVGGIFAFLGAALTLAIILLCVLGLASLASLLGSQVSKTKSAGSYLRGGLLLLLAGLTPYLGWFIFTPLILFTGLGAAIQTVFRRKEKAG